MLMTHVITHTTIGDSVKKMCEKSGQNDNSIGDFLGKSIQFDLQTCEIQIVIVMICL